MRLRNQDVLLPTTHVGSYPRPLFMQGKVFPAAADDPEFLGFRQRQLYHDAVALVVKDQNDVGLDIVTDGGQHYENETDYEMSELFHYLPQHLEGVLPFGERLQVGAWDVPIWKPTVVGPVGWRRPVFKPIIEALRVATTGPCKINVGIGPATMAILCTDRHYGGDTVALAMDLAAAYNEELKDLERRGCDQIQLTEPLPILMAALDPQPWVVEAVNRAFDGVSAYKVVHMCYGHLEGQPAHGMRTVNKVFPFAFDLDCDQIHLEAASHDLGEVEALSGWPADKDLGLGVIDVKSLRAESPEQIAHWIQAAAKVVPVEQICLSTDCSISSLRRVVARRKLAAMVEGANQARQELGGL